MAALSLAIAKILAATGLGVNSPGARLGPVELALSALHVLLQLGPPVWLTLALSAKRHRSMGLPGWTGPLVLVGLVAAARTAFVNIGIASPASQAMSLLLLLWLAAVSLWPRRRGGPEQTAEVF